MESLGNSDLRSRRRLATPLERSEEGGARRPLVALAGDGSLQVARADQRGLVGLVVDLDLVHHRVSLEETEDGVVRVAGQLAPGGVGLGRYVDDAAIVALGLTRGAQNGLGDHLTTLAGVWAHPDAVRDLRFTAARVLDGLDLGQARRTRGVKLREGSLEMEVLVDLQRQVEVHRRLDDLRRLARALRSRDDEALELEPHLLEVGAGREGLHCPMGGDLVSVLLGMTDADDANSSLHEVFFSSTTRRS